MPSSPFLGRPRAHGHPLYHYRGPPRSNSGGTPLRIITRVDTHLQTRSGEQRSILTTDGPMSVNITNTRRKQNQRTTETPHPTRQIPIGLPESVKTQIHIITATTKPNRPGKEISRQPLTLSRAPRCDEHRTTITGNKPHQA